MPVVVTEPPVAVGVADIDKRDAAITCAVDPTPVDGSQWPILAASSVSTSSVSSRQLVDVPKWTTVVRRSPAKQAKPRIQPVAVQPSTTTRTRKTKGVTGSGSLINLSLTRSWLTDRRTSELCNTVCVAMKQPQLTAWMTSHKFEVRSERNQCTIKSFSLFLTPNTPLEIE